MRGRIIKTLSLIILLIFFISFSGCKDIREVFELEDPDDFEISDVISIDTASDTLKANGVDKLKVTATLEGDTADGLKITFTTSTGTFAGTDKKEEEVTAAGKIAEVFLISSIKKETAILSATVTAQKGQITYTYKSESAEVEFTPVLPEDIYLVSDQSVIKADGKDTATLTATLRPPGGIGTVTENTLVIFKAVHVETGTEIPNLSREELSDNTGKAVARLTSSKMGDYEITCSVTGADNATTSIIIKFVPG
jgi:hypothetical protein